MTERLPQSAIALQLLEAMSLNLKLARVWMTIAEQSDQRFFHLRQDMQRNYGQVAEEARSLVEELSAKVDGFLAQRADLPQSAQQQLAAIESDLAHIKHMLAGSEEG